jgi:hypothetical protein
MSNNNSTAWRNGYKWTVNECLRLEREYDLLQLTVPQMATLHNRTPYAIIYKLHQEGIADFNELYIQTYGNASATNDVLIYPSLLPVDVEVDSEDDEYVPKLVQNESDDEFDSDEEQEDVNDYYLAEQVKSLQRQVSILMNYLTKGKSKGGSHLRSVL